MGEGSTVILAQPDGSGARPIDFTSGVLPISGPVVSPDGERLAFIAPSSLPPRRVAVVADFEGAVLARQEVCGRFQLQSVGWFPDGRRLAAQCDANVGLLLYDSTLTSYTVLYDVAPSATIGVLEWSPDGSWILDGNLLLSADKRNVSMVLPDSMVGVGWTADNRVLVTRGCNRGVWIWRPGTTTVESFLPPPYWRAAFSPDQQRLLVAINDCAEDRSVAVLDARTHVTLWSRPGVLWGAWRP